MMIESAAPPPSVPRRVLITLSALLMVSVALVAVYSHTQQPARHHDGAAAASELSFHDDNIAALQTELASGSGRRPRGRPIRRPEWVHLRKCQGHVMHAGDICFVNNKIRAKRACGYVRKGQQCICKHITHSYKKQQGKDYNSHAAYATGPTRGWSSDAGAAHHFSSLGAAERACNKRPQCRGITKIGGNYMLRKIKGGALLRHRGVACHTGRWRNVLSMDASRIELEKRPWQGN